MVAHFIDEFTGQLRLSPSKTARQAELGLDIPLYAREVMHKGEQHDEYFTSDQFCLQVAKADRLVASSTHKISITSFFNLTRPKFMWLMTMMLLLSIG